MKTEIANQWNKQKEPMDKNSPAWAISSEKDVRIKLKVFQN